MHGVLDLAFTVFAPSHFKKIVDKLITEWVTGVGVIFHSAGVVCYIYQPPPHTSGCKHTFHTTSIYIFRHIIHTAYKHNFNIYNKGSAVCKLWADHKQLTLSLLDSWEAQHFDIEEIYSFIMLWFIYFNKEETEKFRVSIYVNLNTFYFRDLTMVHTHYRDGFLKQVRFCSRDNSSPHFWFQKVWPCVGTE